MSARTVTVRLDDTEQWARATATVDGRRVKRVKHPTRFKVRNLPQRPFTFKLTAITDDGRTATAKRHYRPCPSSKPVVAVPDGAAPTTLIKRDLIVGTGAKPRSHHAITVQYVGSAWSTKQEIDSSWSRHAPFAFTFKAGQVIEGFDQGIDGMRVGGRREVTIPPKLGYGDTGSGAIGPNETLVFVIDLIGVD